MVDAGMAEAVTLNPLADHLARRIAAEGPLTVAQYMAEALSHPRYGYYAAGRDPIGASGDFVTAPEISQMFGELIGLWLIEQWRRMGRPSPVTLVELGPGRGSLLSDLLRAARMDPTFRSSLSLHLVEISDALRRRQAEALAREIADGLAVTWHATLADLPDPADQPGPLFLIANEYVDALPIRQFQYFCGAWRERLVDLQTPPPAPASADDRRGRPAFRFVLGPPNAPPSLMIPQAVRSDRLLEPGSIAEVRPGVPALAAEVGARLSKRGGVALFIDYGNGRSAPADTFQALRHHARAEPLDDPGAADLTAHVDFAILHHSCLEAGARPHGPITQGAFLSALGIEARSAALKKQANHRQAVAIDQALHRLIHPSEMGTLFKCLAVTGHSDPVPYGFDHPTVAVPGPTGT